MSVGQRIRKHLSHLAESGGVKRMRFVGGKVVPTNVVCAAQTELGNALAENYFDNVPDRRGDHIDDLPTLDALLLSTTGLSTDERIALKQKAAGVRLVDIAQQLGVSREQVRRIISRAIEFLQRDNDDDLERLVCSRKRR
jgi:DNA-directed RNA polymerase specialized sigma24 family protein